MAGTNWNRREFVQHGAAGLAAAWAARSGLASQAAMRANAGPANAHLAAGRMSLANRAIAAVWETSAQGLRLASVRAPGLPALLTPAPAFTLRINGVEVASNALRLVGAPRQSALRPNPRAANLAERLPGQQLEATLADPAGKFHLAWRALLRDGSHYIRQEITLTAANSALPVAEVTLLDLANGGAQVMGTVAGSPVVIGHQGGGWFLGFEHPLSASAVDNGRARCFFTRALPLPAGQSAAYSSVIGAAAPGQLRRDFLAYVERERAHPYRPFLHYNSWFDLGYFTPYDQAGCLDVIHAFGQQLHQRRGVKLDSFLFDDGWDNHQNWGFNSGFPDGFTPLQSAAAKIGAAPGVWLSPWGGYGKPRQQRLAYARAHGFETNREGLALSGPVYYKLFHQVCLEMITKYGVNQFKLDGTGSTAQVVPGSAFGSDFEAAISLIGDMRAARPDLYVNLTTGTYPSPFWLRYADSTWRGGSDTSFAGVGSDRQQWITYRDADTFRHVVGRGPLYPLNALMLHGIVFAKHARRLSTDPNHDFDAEVRSYFGTGTQLQEMYISHDLLGPAEWDVLAEAAQWARRNAAILVDTHWIGGDPGQLQPYGHAAWSPAGAILTLRNPSDQPQALELDLAAALELPPGAPARFRFASPWQRDQWRQPQASAPLELAAGDKHRFALRPFEVLTLEARA
ncbi:MAG TPA: enterotoxin [Terriglobales bacterium]|nr:enterotoxin [Terriglobales bacterium]